MSESYEKLQIQVDTDAQSVDTEIVSLDKIREAIVVKESCSEDSKPDVFELFESDQERTFMSPI